MKNLSSGGGARNRTAMKIPMIEVIATIFRKVERGIRASPHRANQIGKISKWLSVAIVSAIGADAPAINKAVSRLSESGRRFGVCLTFVLSRSQRMQSLQPLSVVLNDKPPIVQNHNGIFLMIGAHQ